jgi:hypothetical protein
MNEKASKLSARLIRNFNDSEMESFVRAPLYESAGVRLGTDTAAVKLGGQ